MENKEIAVLLLEKRGCNFWNDDEEMQKYSDVGNYRVFCKGLQVKKNTTYIDFSRGFKRIFKKDENGNITDYKNIHHHRLSAEIYQYIKKGTYYNCFGNCRLEKKIQNFNYNYTLKEILKAVNKINDFKIEEIFIFDNIYNKIENIAGYREKTILECCNKITLIQNDNNYQVFRFYNENNEYFEYETKNNRITG